MKIEDEERLPVCSLQQGRSLLQQSELDDEMNTSPAQEETATSASEVGKIAAWGHFPGPGALGLGKEKSRGFIRAGLPFHHGLLAHFGDPAHSQMCFCVPPPALARARTASLELLLVAR